MKTHTKVPLHAINEILNIDSAYRKSVVGTGLTVDVVMCWFVLVT